MFIFDKLSIFCVKVCYKEYGQYISSD